MRANPIRRETTPATQRQALPTSPFYWQPERCLAHDRRSQRATVW
ncbi:MAG: hypothetical protein ACK4YL_21010 [Microcystis sp.]|nr:hypothetical protein [Microcystis aeruginosa]